jgi:hypothetical protein
MEASTALFELRFAGGLAEKLHVNALGDVEQAYPWESLDPARYPPALVARARFGWTENAFNEYCTAVVMGQLVQAFGEALVPLDIWSMACRLPAEEILHVELCARVAMRLGGGAPLAFDTRSVAHPLDVSLTPRQRANELAVSLLCVGEALSLPLLAGSLRAASHPLTRAVLQRIVEDEALHGKLGWMYLNWVAPELSLSERDRLAEVAAHALQKFTPLWERLASKSQGDRTSEGFRLQDVHDLGWMEATRYRVLARDTIQRDVLGPLRERGISVKF